MMPARLLSVIGLLAVLASGVSPSVASADSRDYRLHVQGHLGCGRSFVDLDIPWESGGGTPFDFTADAVDDPGLKRLLEAWTTLQRMPEGSKVTIEGRSQSIRASKSGGYLVLEPRHRDDRDDHHSRIKIPDYIVEAILDHDGQLTDRDIERLVRERGKVTLVKVNSDVGGGTVWLDRRRSD